ncbi:hypothetical protein IAE22_30160, partial [Bacillus sp. S34]|nr:hypothetical protein [Bacillus sp. S34]
LVVGRDRLLAPHVLAGVDDLLVDLGFTKRHPGFQAEGLAWRPDGSTIKGVEPKNDTVPIEVGPGESFELYVADGMPILRLNRRVYVKREVVQAEYRRRKLAQKATRGTR